MKRAGKLRDGFTLIELLVAVAIAGALAGLVTFAVSQAMTEQQKRQCLTNLLMVEAARDEYARDHPGSATVEGSGLNGYLRFGVPGCPAGGQYDGLHVLDSPVGCSKHGTVDALRQQLERKATH
jgi:prepilin-type N-terminal cleavage/methylation domain-containing protein